MLKRISQTLLLFCLIAAQWNASVAQCNAGPMLDWIHGYRTTPSYAWSAAYRPNTAYRATAVYRPTTIYRPTTAYHPTTAYRPTLFNGYGINRYWANRPWLNRHWAGRPVLVPPTYSQTVVNYAPHTAYRTSWVKVPVTSYRPVLSTDPVTGQPVSSMAACTSYTWQARRIPYTTYRPVYGQAYASGCGSCGWVAPGCSSCGVAAPATVEQPYYPNYPTPAASGAATQGSSSRSESEPADKKPSLKEGAAKSQNGLPGSNTRFLSKSPFTSPTVKPAAKTPEAPQRQSFKVKPIPDPDAKGPDAKGANNPSDAPALIDPNDRTAKQYPISQTWAVAPIVWNQAPAQSAAAAPKQKEWDDSGWSSVKP